MRLGEALSASGITFVKFLINRFLKVSQESEIADTPYLKVVGISIGCALIVLVSFACGLSGRLYHPSQIYRLSKRTEC